MKKEENRQNVESCKLSVNLKKKSQFMVLRVYNIGIYLLCCFHCILLFHFNCVPDKLCLYWLKSGLELCKVTGGQ